MSWMSSALLFRERAFCNIKVALLMVDAEVSTSASDTDAEGGGE